MQPAPPPAETTAQPPARKRSGLTVALAVIAALVLAGVAVAVTLAMTGGGSKPAAKPPSAWDLEQAQRSAAAREVLPDPAPATEGPELRASDVKLSLKTIDKECFGSAGCNLQVQVQAKHAGGYGTFKSPDTWLVTYEITGGEDGPVIGSFEISDSSYDMNTESVSTRSSKVKLSVKVVDVEKQGL